MTLQAVKFGTEIVRTFRTSSACGVERLVGRIQPCQAGLARLSAVPFRGSCVESNHGLIKNGPILRSSISLERNEHDRPQRCLHTSAYVMHRKWERHNRKLYPPQKPGEPPRMAKVYYSRQQIKHSMRKMWYIATFVKGMMIDDALNQLQFINKKGAGIVREVWLFYLDYRVFRYIICLGLLLLSCERKIHFVILGLALTLLAFWTKLS